MISTLGLALLLVATPMFVWSEVDDRRGDDAVAEVLGVERGGRRWQLRIRFTTETGEACESTLPVTYSQRKAARVGDRVDIRYPRSRPCRNTRRSGDSEWWWMGVVVALLVVFGVLTYQAWRPPGRALPLRYQNLP